MVITNAPGQELAEIAEGIGEATNNVAEYMAAAAGLRKAGDLGAKDVTLRSDSQLLIMQLTGRYRVRSEHLRPLHAEVMGQVARFRSVRFEHVPREDNAEADRLANLGVDRWLAARAARS